MTRQKSFYKLFTEDVNKTDVLSWLEEELNKLTPKQFGETCIAVIVHERYNENS